MVAAVRRRVWTRDEGRCAFVGTHGRCTEHGFLEFHHVVPYAAGGKAAADNIELRCRAHNQYEADKYFTGRSQPVVRERPELSWMTSSVQTELICCSSRATSRPRASASYAGAGGAGLPAVAAPAVQFPLSAIHPPTRNRARRPNSGPETAISPTS